MCDLSDSLFFFDKLTIISNLTRAERPEINTCSHVTNREKSHDQIIKRTDDIVKSNFGAYYISKGVSSIIKG